MICVGVVVCTETAQQGDESVVRSNAASAEEDSNCNRSVVCHMKVALLFPLLILQQLHHEKNGKGDYPPTRVVQNQVMPCNLLSFHIHPSWSRIPNRLVPTLVHAHAPGSLANECGTVQYNSGLYNSWGPFGRLVVQMVCLYPSQSHLFRMRVKRATTASILCVMNQTNDRRSGDE